MPIERDIWTQPFTKHRVPDWPCPKCYKGVLELLHATTKETAASQLRPDWDPDYTTFVFGAVLSCTYRHCKEVISCCGKARIEVQHAQVHLPREAEIQAEAEEEADEAEAISAAGGGPGMEDPTQVVTQRVTVFEPVHWHPALHLFPITPYPECVQKELVAAFGLFFADTSACANRIRACVEVLLTDRKMRRFECKSGKRIRIGLHRRITEFATKNPEAAKKLSAIKWIGNAGSHVETVTCEDILDQFELLESALDDLYVQHIQRIERLARDVNKQKRPRSAR